VKHDWFSASAEGILGSLWVANPMKIALLRPGFVPNRDTQKLFTDISSFEVTGTGYIAGGNTLTTKSASYDASQDRTNLVADDPTWGPGATFDAAYAAVYDNSGTKILWSLVDFEGTKSVSGGTFLIDFAAVGFLSLVTP